MIRIDESEAFDHFLEHSFLLDSLLVTLDQMLEDSFIRKETATRIIKEASLQCRTLLTSSNFVLHRHIMIGKLKQYKFKNDTWIFYVKNPTFKLCINSDNRQFLGGDYNDFSIDQVKVPRSNDSNEHMSLKDSNTSLEGENTVINYNGCIKIIAAFMS